MALGTTVLVLVAVLASFSGNANGFILNRSSRQTVDASADAKGENEVATKDPHPPTELAVGCFAETALSYSCGVDINANIMGNQIAFDPKINLEFVESNMTIVLSVTNQDKTLIRHEIPDKDNVPMICIPLPQFPVIQFCLEFHDMSCSTENKTLSVCTVLGINTVHVPLPVHPSLPVGCFQASATEGLKYSPPEFKIPGKEQVDQLIGGIQAPLKRAASWPFGSGNKDDSQENNKRAVTWPFGNKDNEEKNKNNGPFGMIWPFGNKDNEDKKEATEAAALADNAEVEANAGVEAKAEVAVNAGVEVKA